MRYIPKYISSHFHTASLRACGMVAALCFVSANALLISCEREPALHLHDESSNCTVELPALQIDLETMWDYQFNLGVDYDWKAEWFYGWDETDASLFGTLGYNKPEIFELRRYYTNDVLRGPHKAPYKHLIKGSALTSGFKYGYWDILAWNDIQTPDGVQSVRIDEKTTFDYVTASTGETMTPVAYSRVFTRAFYQPEELFSGYEDGIEINQNLDGFEYDEVKRRWVRRLNMRLQPVTYIYLPQIILHHNKRDGRLITSIDGSANLCGMARTVNLNTGVAGNDAITVNFNMRMKRDMVGRNKEEVDIIGGKVLTFGIPKLNVGSLSSRAYTESLKQVRDADLNNRHYLDVTMQFYNGKDSTFVFDVTNQVRRLYRGGVITIELDMDTIPVPNHKGGSGFDAVVKDFEEKEWEFDM